MSVSLNVKISEEEMVRVSKACASIPGGKVSPKVIERWIRKGVRGVKLEIMWVGNVRYTSAEAIRRFLDATNRNSELPSSGFHRMSDAEIERSKAEQFGKKTPGRKPGPASRVR